MHFSVLQRYTFYNLNIEIEIFALRCNQITIHFKTLDFQAPHGNKTFLHIMVKHVVDIRKITLRYHKTLTLGYVPLTLTLGISYCNVKVQRYIEYIQTFHFIVT